MSRAVLKPAEGSSRRRSGGRDLKRSNTKGSERLRPAGQSTVFVRLQALFPSSVPAPWTSGTDAPVLGHPPPTAQISKRVSPRFLKVHVVSWNMHDSLPKGNLEDLLGAVPPYVPCPEDETDKFRIPNMSADDCHPYHLVVVSGQECPTVSGIPMGLGASFRYKEKEKHKDCEKAAKRTKGKEGKDKDKDDPLQLDGPSTSNPPLSSSSDTHSMASPHGPTSGWSWILEEWYCRGLGQRDSNATTSSATELYNSQATSANADAATEANTDAGLQNDHDATCTIGKEKKKRKACCCKDKTRIGPYELLVKERLMGIYVAVFIYRDLKPLVRGISKSAVSTGLIGGRVGNKGGVGISVNLDGTTLLFINAHLAAHEERVMNRVANFTKIKSELQVNDFLSQDDPRVMSEDLTDKFDYTFVFGDLNFRLDVTRLHADWLIARQDYEQALSFDQLQTLMKKGEAFVGFNEAPIHFPPTFKYDVMKTLKRDRSSAVTKELGKARVHKRWLGQRSNPNLAEVQETEAELSTRLADEQERGVSIDAEEDAISFVSTARTAISSRSRVTANEERDDNDAFYSGSKSPRLSNQSKDDDVLTSGNATQKLFRAKAAFKAKAKWLSMLKSNNGTRSSGARRESEKSKRSAFSASFPQLKSRFTSSDSTKSTFRAASSAVELSRSRAPSFATLRRASSRKSAKSAKSSNALTSVKSTENTAQESTAYDTSSKQRVPSWCDRILWKTTVKPEPESDDEEDLVHAEHRNSGLGPRMMAFLSNAFRPLGTRTRTVSLSSIPPVSVAEIPPSFPAKIPSRPGTSKSDSQPLMRQVSRVSEKEPALFKATALANLVNMRHGPREKARNPKLLKSRSIEPVSTTPLISSSIRKSRDRAYTAMPVISAPVVTFPEDSTLIPEVETTTTVEVPPDNHVARQRTTSTRGWLLRFPFFTREAEVIPPTAQLSLESPQPQEVFPRRPRRGEVVSLGYNSLDDQAMRRLEGRSDHRPVIGSYAIYI